MKLLHTSQVTKLLALRLPEFDISETSILDDCSSMDASCPASCGISSALDFATFLATGGGLKLRFRLVRGGAGEQVAAGRSSFSKAVCDRFLSSSKSSCHAATELYPSQFISTEHYNPAYRIIGSPTKSVQGWCIELIFLHVAIKSSYR